MDKLIKERERFGAWIERRRKPAKCPLCACSTIEAANASNLPSHSDEMQQMVNDGHIILHRNTFHGDIPEWQCKQCGVYIFKNTVSEYFEMDQISEEELKNLVEVRYHVHLKSISADDAMWLLTLLDLKTEEAAAVKKDIWRRVIGNFS